MIKKFKLDGIKKSYRVSQQDNSKIKTKKIKNIYKIQKTIK